MFINNKKGRGYTEIAVVVTILLIISLFTIPRYQNLKRDAYKAQITNDSKIVESFVVEHNLKNAKIPNGSKIITDSELKVLVRNKKSYLKGEILKPLDIDNIKGQKYILDRSMLISQVGSRLEGDFIYTNEGVIYVATKITIDDITPEKPTGGAWDKYNTKLLGYDVVVLGFNSNYKENVTTIEDIVELEVDEFRVVEIQKNSYANHVLKGEFPELKHLRVIGDGAFKNSIFTGNFPKLNSLERIGNNSFQKSKFTGSFPEMDKLTYIGWNSLQSSKFNKTFPSVENLEYIGALAFMNSNFTGEFPSFNDLKIIGNNAFENSIFTNKFGDQPQLRKIGNFAFKNSKFQGSFPQLNEIESIGMSAFLLSSFDGTFPHLSKIKNIDDSAFYNSIFTGDYPAFLKNVSIGPMVFYKSKFNNIPSISTIKYKINNKEYNKAQELIDKLPGDKDKEKLQDFLNVSYSLVHNPNVGGLSNGNGWGRVKTTKIGELYRVTAKENAGGFGIITDRDIGVNYKRGQEYIITCEIKSSNIKALRYNYIISDVGNLRIGNIYINNNNEWQDVSLRFVSTDKDRINAGVLIGGDLRPEPKGTEFEVRNVSIKEISKFK